MTSVMRTSVVCIFIFLWRIQANNYSEPYICYGDVCNSESPAQFCDVVYRHCRRCDDIRGDCFTRHQTFNCTEYCYEIRYKEEVEKLRGCTILSPQNNGHLDDHRTHVPFNDTLKFTCNDGYVPTFIDLVRCGEFSMWSGPLPKCEISTNKTPTLLTIICVVCGVCFLVSLLGNIFMIYSLNKSQFRLWLKEFNEKRMSPKERKRLLDSNKSETDVKICNGTGLSAERTSPAASAPEEQGLDVVICSNSDITQSSQHPDKHICNDTINEDRGRRFTGSNQTLSQEAHVPSVNGRIGHDSSSHSTRDEEINNPSVNGGSTVGNIINNITTTNVHLHVSSTPQPTSVGPSTATSQPRETDSTLTDKRPVEETDILGSQSGTPSQTVRAVPPENDGTALKSI
ncbi:uncharacterized protein LOC127856571 isoform X3 [Dreissena polymorpha]|uniref:uncharacterized protein LOC127856571 isoform X3 n=1 Tax=Dreissena polymorpha TaxID=45954 RepID=UPI0022653E0F|nr:uncharacterized protein LOC127856571 isoform X3 [Dreissena polymorpha]